MDLAKLSLLLVVLTLFCGKSTYGAPGQFSFASIYADNMVLQKSPARATIRGYAVRTGMNVFVEFDDVVYEVESHTDELGFASWSVSLEPTEGGPYDINAEDEDGTIVSIANVLFGDVWFCSGQSNMQMPLSQTDNGEDDIADSVNYPDVRILTGALAYSSERYPEPIIQQEWSVPDGSNVAEFSAVCWGFGTRLYDSLNYPIGLIQSAYGGTRIEAWSSQEALDVCFPDGPDDGFIYNKATVLYNAMVYPYLGTVIYGSIWYQGENNMNNPEDYGCAMSALVSDWRSKWNMGTAGSTDLVFPFGQVQLAPWNPPSDSFGFANVRWAQTNYQGYTPNEAMPRVFTAIAMDLPDFDSPTGSIHPRYKRQISDRLWVGALQLGYNITSEGRYQGPYPSSFVLAGNRRMEIDYDDFRVTLEYRDTVNSTMFEICCSLTNDCPNDSTNNWFEATLLAQFPAEVVLTSPCPTNDEVSRLRYAWRDSPCVDLENCAIYSAASEINTLSLPAPPFVVDSSAWS